MMRLIKVYISHNLYKSHNSYKLPSVRTPVVSTLPAMSTSDWGRPSIGSTLQTDPSSSSRTSESIRDDHPRYPDDTEKFASCRDLQSTSLPRRTYAGSGTSEAPYIVDWDPDDPEDPYNWSKARKWLITSQVRLNDINLS